MIINPTEVAQEKMQFNVRALDGREDDLRPGNRCISVWPGYAGAQLNLLRWFAGDCLATCFHGIVFPSNLY